MLYGACARAAFALGYRRVITYIQGDEPGTSLAASSSASSRHGPRGRVGTPSLGHATTRTTGASSASCGSVLTASTLIATSARKAAVSEQVAIRWTERPTNSLNADESAELMQALRKEPASDALRAAAEQHPVEADEAVEQVKQGHDHAVDGSWVAEVLAT
jgi:hypothetical protein